MLYYENLRKRLQDEESEKIFDARIEYMHTSDTLTFIKTMDELYKNFQYLILDDFLKERKAQLPLVIFGAGCGGEITFEILKHTKYSSRILGFCDNNKELWGKTKRGLPIMSLYELLASKKEVVYILASTGHNSEFLHQLLNLNVPQKDIFVAPFGEFLMAERGVQYFDVFQPCENEVFVDAGAYDGMTSRAFVNWCNGKYKKIYMFEANPEMKPVCQSNVETDERIIFKGKCLWSKNTWLKLNNVQNASYVEETEDDKRNANTVQACALDSELANENVTFIKMDVEGSEIEALRGTERIIQSLQPKLAISVYHKLDDMVKIMDYLISIKPEYKFYLRHYTACQWETVLYAV